MIGKLKQQVNLFDVGNVYSLALKPGSFHAQLAGAASRLFRDEDFIALYSERMGRPSVPPSLLALTVLLQSEAGVSDEEAIERTAFDLRWAAVLGRQAGEPLCAKSTLQLFRAHLVLHDNVGRLFQASIQEAKRSGLLRGQALSIAVDTKPIHGRGAVQDTFNLLAGGIRQLAAALARSESKPLDDWMHEQDLDRYREPSIKGSVQIDWSDPQARDRFLTEIASDAQRLLGLVRQLTGGPEANPLVKPEVQASTQLLGALLLQDVQIEQVDQTHTEQAHIKRGTAPGRIPSVHDPEQRHGHKSENHLFTGFKASVAVDTDSQIIVSADVLSADSGDAVNALLLTEEAEAITGLPVQATLGDCTYGGGPTRKAFDEAGRELLARVPTEWSRDGLCPKSAFVIDLERNTVQCPAGHSTSVSSATKDGGRKYFFGRVRASCPLRTACTKCTKARSGRTVQVHAQEALLKAARTYQNTPAGRHRLRTRVVVEHRLARLGQLGIGQARYMGKAKTRFQLLVAATIANLRRAWNWQRSGEGKPDPSSHSSSVPRYLWLYRCLIGCKSAIVASFVSIRWTRPTYTLWAVHVLA